MPDLEYRIPRDRFPFTGHRTLADVDETERLQVEYKSDYSRRARIGYRLSVLLGKAEAFNPVPAPAEEARA